MAQIWSNCNIQLQIDDREYIDKLDGIYKKLENRSHYVEKVKNPYSIHIGSFIVDKSDFKKISVDSHDILDKYDMLFTKIYDEFYKKNLMVGLQKEKKSKNSFVPEDDEYYYMSIIYEPTGFLTKICKVVSDKIEEEFDKAPTKNDCEYIHTAICRLKKRILKLHSIEKQKQIFIEFHKIILKSSAGIVGGIGAFTLKMTGRLFDGKTFEYFYKMKDKLKCIKKSDSDIKIKYNDKMYNGLKVESDYMKKMWSTDSSFIFYKCIPNSNEEPEKATLKELDMYPIYTIK